MNLENYKKVHFKYKVCSQLLLVFFGILFASKNPVSMSEPPINKFEEQLSTEAFENFENIYAAESLHGNYNLFDVHFAEHSDNNIDYAYITSIYANDRNEKITFIQSKDPFFDIDLLQKTNITDTVLTENIYYFTEANSSNILFWYYENTTYFLISNFDYETSKDISQELLANKIN